MKSVAFGLTSCSSGLVPESKLSHKPEAQYGFVPKHSHHGGKNIALRAKNRGLPQPLQKEGSTYGQWMWVWVKSRLSFGKKCFLAKRCFCL